ncbi:glucosidase 2 subunit beta [Acipenser oxyrinchus oxyrinchus]|uniref:Glucosidase 2 subunit beta n=1 Tax=Acipenser oxyrinchus oxyrinchus TaxID=40147 RepID=A0AAD8CLY4_ACIOX|nr:glucosidase 2 subunit beta [Acipenser oxyrinchus oxyrinchus]
MSGIWQHWLRKLAVFGRSSTEKGSDKTWKMASVYLALSLFLSCSLAVAVEIQRPRGVSLSNRHFYDQSKPFTCLDGSRTIPFDRVNDDYCDCKDSSDEPGTSACPRGNFHCTNAGHRPQYIPSSRVNDGICDCCDATDEYNSGSVCENTCRELGRKEKEILQQRAAVAQQGFLVKQQLIDEAKKGQEEKSRKLAELQESKDGKEDELEALRTVKEAAEAPEKEAKDQHHKAWEEQKAALRLEKDKARMALAFLELDDNADGLVSVEELQTHLELDPDSDGTLTEPEAQTMLGEAPQVDQTAFQDIVWASIKDKYQSETEPETPSQPETPQDPPSERLPEEEGEEDEEEEDEEDEDIDAEEDGKIPPVVSQTEKPEKEEEMPPYEAETQALIDAAQKSRDTFDEAEKALRDLEEQIRSLEKEISFDFGPSAEFSYLYSQCYELTTGEYVYRLCPFSRVTQKQKFGGSETNLGTWGSWAGPEDDKYSVMKYEQGTGCWQGPNRSTTVKLTCGTETAVVSTSEPSRCEYQVEFTTPAVCQEPKELDPASHDEL